MAYNGAGIYGIYNVVKNKIYIGKSSNIARRFSNHRSNFRHNRNDYPMYREPIENCVFLVLCKMTNDEYAKYGDLYEELFIAQAQMSKIGVYNDSLVRSYEWALSDVMYYLSVRDNLNREIRERCNHRLCDIQKMSKESREMYAKYINRIGKET